MNPARVARALIAVYPAAWRRRYQAEYLALLRETGMSPRIALDVLIGAIRERFRYSWVLSTRPLRAESALALFAITFLALFGFFGGWSDIHKQVTFDMEWRGVQFCDMAFAGVGVILARRGRPWLGYPTILAAVVALLWQMSVGPLPGWTASIVPFQFVLVWYAVVVVVLGWLVLRLPGGIPRAETPGPTAQGPQLR